MFAPCLPANEYVHFYLTLRFKNATHFRKEHAEEETRKC